MPRSLWKGTISFGLISIPVKLYGATEEKNIAFHQVHDTDGGRIRYRRVCERCGEEVPYEHIAKGYEAEDGRQAVLESADFEDLPLPSAKAIQIDQFVDVHEIDPAYFAKAYFVEADAAGVKPYVLLRQALAESGRVGIVKVALRSRETLALVRARGEVLMLHTMMWPDELRDGDFAAPPDTVQASTAEVEMAKLFIEQLAGEFDPSKYTDVYREAVEQVVAAKLEGAELPPVEPTSAGQAEVVDLVAALRASVEAAQRRREGTVETGAKAG